DAQPVSAPLFESACRGADDERFGPEWQRDVERTADNSSGKTRRRHSDDLERYAVDDQRLADNVRSAAEMTLPEVVANHCHRPVRPATANIVRGSERTSERRGNPQRFEE